MHTKLTRHALLRVLERLHMKPEEVPLLLDWGLGVRIGDEPETQRTHWLFYSREDQECFVAVRDERTRYIITVLPIEFHENLAWKVSMESMREAARLVSERPLAQEHRGSLASEIRTVQVDSATVHSGAHWPCDFWPYERAA